jgi:transcriptional regulator with XRE-family HTH domain
MKHKYNDHIMLSGMEFRAIRKFSRITQETISSYLGYNNTETVRQIERQELVPEKFCKILEFISQYDLSDREKVDQLLEKIPQKYKEIRYQRRIDGFYAMYKVMKHLDKQKQLQSEQNRPKTFFVTLDGVKYSYNSETDEVSEVRVRKDNRDD